MTLLVSLMHMCQAKQVSVSLRYLPQNGNDFSGMARRHPSPARRRLKELGGMIMICLVSFVQGDSIEQPGPWLVSA